MKAQELQRELGAVDSDADVVLAANGALLQISGVTFVPGKTIAVIRGKSKSKLTKRFTTEEDGVVGYLGNVGLSDEMIAEVLGRTPDGVRRRRRTLGLL
jgi:hypothetical protein